tara:strand:+ start:2238 stop:3119 length:882 start_codon:yes stop_codon:yes gene_type:complete
MSCSICCEDLTIDNIVNPECGHSTCKDCFWRWAKDKNTCPFCRTNLLKNTEEAKDIQQMRDLLSHRTRIIREVEAEYETQDRLVQQTRQLMTRTGALEEMQEELDKNINDKKTILNNIEKNLGGFYATYRYYKRRVNSITQENRKTRERIDRAAQHLAHGSHGMSMDVLKDIKCLRNMDANWRHDKHKLIRVLWMNETRKERKKFREERLREGSNFELQTLFEEQQEIPSFPEPIGLYDEFGERLRDILNSNQEIDFMQMMDLAINQVGSEELLNIFNEEREFINEEINNLSR